MNRGIGTFDVAVLGAGIVGAAIADALVDAGLRVMVADGAEPGSGATAAGMGHVVVMSENEAEFALTLLGQRLWLELAAHLPRSAAYSPIGTLWVAADDEEMGEVHRKAAYYGARELRPSIVDETALRALEPNLRPGLAGGLYMPSDAVVYAPAAAQWLLHRALRAGAEFHPAYAVAVNEDTVEFADGAKCVAGQVVCAAGLDTVRLFPGTPLRPRKGHLVLASSSPGFVRHQLVELGYVKSVHGAAAESVAFNVQPRGGGRLLIGASRQFGVETAVVEPGVVARMLERADQYLPDTSRLPVVRTWTGFRACSPDGLPLIGPHPEQAGVWLATGHEGLGITTALATASLIRSGLAGEPTAIGPTPYRPSRFSYGK